jgi:YD repeat-containing protein
MKKTLLMAGGFLVAVGCFPDTGEAQLASLSATQTIPIEGETATDFVLPVKTDEGGNIYLRYGMPDSSYRPLIKLSVDGRKVSSFDVSAVPGYEGSQLRDFCADRHGNLITLVRKRDGTAHLLTFDSQGNLQSTNELDGNIDPYAIALVGDEKLVLSGRITPTQRPLNAGPDSAPLVVITDLRGKILKQVDLPGDIMSATPQSSSRLPRKDLAFEVAVAGALLETGEDKNVYLARPGRPDFIYAISAEGTVLHRIALKIPSGSVLCGLKVRTDQLAIETIEHADAGDRTRVTRSEVQIYSAPTGQLLESSLLGPKIPINLASFQQGGSLIFVGSSEDTTVTLFRAHVRP